MRAFNPLVYNAAAATAIFESCPLARCSATCTSCPPTLSCNQTCMNWLAACFWISRRAYMNRKPPASPVRPNFQTCSARLHCQRSFQTKTASPRCQQGFAPRMANFLSGRSYVRLRRTRKSPLRMSQICRLLNWGCVRNGLTGEKRILPILATHFPFFHRSGNPHRTSVFRPGS